MPEFDSTLEYRSVVGCPGYKVGSDGSVWSSKQSGWKRLKPITGKLGYQRVAIYNPHYRRLLVHRLVLEAFVGPCPAGMQSRHDPDPNRANNATSNLKWGTQEENMRDRDRHGRTMKGEKQHLAKLTAETVRSLRADIASGMSLSAAGRKYGVLHSTARLAVLRRTWKHVL